GHARRAAHFCARAALRAAFRHHAAVRPDAACRPAARRPRDVGAGGPALSDRRVAARRHPPRPFRAGGPSMIWLKTLHLAAIAIWSAGLLGLPGLFVGRTHVPDEQSKHRLQAAVRFLYVGIVSPAAFVAVGSGTALIFLRQSFEPWFTLKLALVGALVTIHILTGLVIIRLFEAGNV